MLLINKPKTSAAFLMHPTIGNQQIVSFSGLDDKPQEYNKLHYLLLPSEEYYPQQ